MKLILKTVILLVFFAPYKSFSQFQKCLGGRFVDGANAIQQTPDGGFITTGFAESIDGDVTGNHGMADVWVVKLDSTGNLQWQKCLGGTFDEEARAIVLTNDGGYIIAGETGSNDGDVIGNHGSGFHDFWIVKLDSVGLIQWQKCLGGTLGDEANSIIQSSDGGYLVAGYTSSNDGDVSGNHGNSDYWVVKLSSLGTVEWQKCFGGTNTDQAKAIHRATDGGYIVIGYTNSNNGDVSGNHGSTDDYWIIKLDSSGTLQWQKCLGGTNNDKANAICSTTDGGYLIVGYTSSNNGDVTGNHGTGNDFWSVKINGLGQIEWQKCFGGSNSEIAFSVNQTNDSGFIIAGYTISSDGDVSGMHGWSDYWVVKIDSLGNFTWQRCLGGSNDESAMCIIQTNDNLFVAAGKTYSDNGDVSGNHPSGGGSSDFWIIKFDEVVGISDIESDMLSTYPNPFNLSINILNNKCKDIYLKNLKGETVIHSNYTQKLNTEYLKAGMYFILLYDDNGKLLSKRKVVKIN